MNASSREGLISFISTAFEKEELTAFSTLE